MAREISDYVLFILPYKTYLSFKQHEYYQTVENSEYWNNELILCKLKFFSWNFNISCIPWPHTTQQGICTQLSQDLALDKHKTAQ
jgi:hypothetical protein